MRLSSGISENRKEVRCTQNDLKGGNCSDIFKKVDVGGGRSVCDRDIASRLKLKNIADQMPEGDFPGSVPYRIICF